MGVPRQDPCRRKTPRVVMSASSGKSCHTGSPPCSLTTSLRWLLPVDTDIIEGTEASGSGACLAVAGCRRLFLQLLVRLDGLCGHDGIDGFAKAEVGPRWVSGTAPSPRSVGSGCPAAAPP